MSVTDVARQRMSDAAKRRWSDPAYKRTQREAIDEGRARETRKPQYVAKGYQPAGKTRKQVAVYIDPDVFEQLAARARYERRSLTEIIRTYIDWGLETEEGASR